ncbi:MAG: hypothetical protein U5J96_14250 [Ignavibacteriaceae bacterium]|nr:hypothetical protein [Ignavibacteriaceae bacterium]
MKNQTLLLFLFLILIAACNPEDLISEFGDSIITAKSKLGEVLNTAKSNFASDAKLAAIYGLNVNTKGQVDLLKPTDNAFVYVVQSDSAQLNEFYVPVYNSYPIKSPINFNTMLTFVKDAQAQNILGSVFGKLAGVNISTSASYDDSPQVIEKMLARGDVTAFRSANPGGKIDMFLVPSKSIDTTSITNTADWIVNFYGDTSSLVLWLHPGTVSGTVDIISN